ncbi:peptidase domain-containing ABC transporter [Jejubacter calystegiae]|uniref:Peptidase domain-containing ABC transporter n=1 Tax=Jejubacter calystegiae TaxID=2579935 RepID=A0A4P8YMQ9_9ENTR|nr:peptidase domain-containing ABC transporter [Jejubacter calystegiae]QCT22141.1 peptidase domain-containing ABC transporter [Jejubacter calystegiae]
MDNATFKHILTSLQFSLRKKVPQLLQSEASECGLACMTMIARYHGMNVDLFSLRSRFGISSHGATLKDLINTAGAIQLQTRALTLDLDELRQLKTPCILHWDLNHFVVLVSVRGNKCILHDPAFGRRVVGEKEMSAHFTGVALELWPGSEFSPVTQRTRISLVQMLKNIGGLGPFLVKIFSLSVVIEAINLLMPVGTQLVMDHVIMAQDHDLLTIICFSLLCFILFRILVGMLRSWSSLVMSSFIDVQWKTGLFEHLMRLPLAYFEKRKLGDIQSRFTSLDVIRNTLTTNLVNSVIDSIMVIGLFVMMILYGGQLVWIVAGFTFIYALIRFMTWQPWRQASEEKIIKSARAGSHFMESLYGINTMKALNLSPVRAQQWINLNIDTTNSTIRLSRLELLFGGINTLLSMIEHVIILWLGASMVIENTITLGMFVAFTAYRAQFSDRAAALINAVLSMRMLTLHSDRLTDIVMTEPEHVAQDSVILPIDEAPEFQLRNLTFRYDNLSVPIFANLNIKIASGENVALTGPSGMGKTTLMKVMAGLLEPTQGEVLVNGLDVSKVGINNYRKYIACVLQDDKLFAGSIADNIASFDTEKDNDWLVECARRCNIHGEIMHMPMGYETLISELGGSLSGGQKQRLLIARALYRRPSLLFLDEATSHLDEANEAHINASIAAMKITRIFIAHRQSTIDTADRIIDLQKAIAQAASSQE